MAQSQPSQDQHVQLLCRSLSSLNLDQEIVQPNGPLTEEEAIAPSPQQQRSQEQSPSEQNGQTMHFQDVKTSNSLPGQTSDEEEPPPSYTQLLQSQQLLPWPQYRQNSNQHDYQLLNEHLRPQGQRSVQQLHREPSSNGSPGEHCPQRSEDPRLSELPLFRVLQHHSRQSPPRGLEQSIHTPVDELQQTCRITMVKLVCLGFVYGIATVIALNVVAFYFNDREAGFYPLMAILVFSSILGVLTALRLFFTRGHHRFTPLQGSGSPHPGPITDVSTTYRHSLPSTSALPSGPGGTSHSSSSQSHRYPQDDRPPAYSDIFPNL